MAIGATGFEPIVMWVIKSLFQRRVIIRIACVNKVDRRNYNDKHHTGNVDGMGRFFQRAIVLMRGQF